MPAPSNDNFASAQALSTSLPGATGGSTFDATMEGSESTTIGSNQQSVWFSFVAPATGWYKFWILDSEITYHGVFGFDDHTLSLRIFPDGALSAMTLTNELADSNCNASNDLDMAVAAFLTSGVTYKIRVSSGKASGTLNSQTADFTIRWDAIAAPANDNLASATVVGAAPVSEVGETTFDATFETAEVVATTLSGSTGSPTKEQSVWYKFTPSATGKYRFRLENIVDRGRGQTRQIIMQVSTQSTLAGYTPANELGRLTISLPSGTQGTQYFDLTSGTDYYIRVSTRYGEKSSQVEYNGSAADFDLVIEQTSPPANDNFANAEVLSTSLPGSLTATPYDATADAGQSTSSPFAAGDQTIWYKFTPTVTGQYKFRIPHSSLVYDGDGSNPNNGSILFAIAQVATVANFVSANFLAGTEFIDFPVAQDGLQFVNLTSGIDYIIGVWMDGTPYNNDSMTFDLEWDLIIPPTNDDFANAQAISGASGSVTFDTEGATSEGSEPRSAYWNGDPSFEQSVWFDWTCPATGDYVFKVEGTFDNTTRVDPNYDLAIWQGAAIGSLTKVTRTWAGSQNVEGRPRAQGTAVGFHAISGQHYKIQVVNWQPNDLPDSKLSWRTNTVAGDTTAGALPLPNGRIDNYGTGETEPPPNFATILGSHDSWWYTDGQVGHVKWFKKVYTTDTTVSINGRMFDGMVESGTIPPRIDVGLICYKGANYAGLTVAKQVGGVNDAAMMIDSGFVESTTRQNNLIDITGTKVNMSIDMLAGETLWIAVFGIYDADIGDVLTDAEDAPQFELDLHIPVVAPANDVLVSVPLVHEYYTDRSEWGNYWAFPSTQAGKRQGSTVGATADVGEGAHAGFGPTRSVWYEIAVYSPGVWHFLVDSPVDCVMSLYRQDGGVNFAGLTEIAFDDDSGPGNNPEITIALTNDTYWVAIDSKTEGDFTLYWNKVGVGTPPANDDFADAQVVGAIPFSASGTTIGGTAEFDEHEAEQLGGGPGDSVWYKYVATFDGQIKIKATCDSVNNDGYVYIDTWRGTALADLVRHPDPPPTGPGGGVLRGFFNYADTPGEVESAAIILDVVNGETYYIRVQTESGSSEDFTIFLDVAEVRLKLTPGGFEVGPYNDAATVRLTLSVSAVIESHGTLFDAATVPLKLTPGATWETQGQEKTDSGIVYFDLSVHGGECFSRFHFTGEGEADPRWSPVSDLVRWSPDDQVRWTAFVEQQPGCE